MSECGTLVGHRMGQAAAELSGDFIFVRDLVLDCAIGAYPEEKGVTQKVSFTVEAVVAPHVRSLDDAIEEVPSYDDIITIIRGLVAEGHINLVETFAERIAARCLEDRRIASVLVRVGKLERGPKAVGVQIVRPRAGASSAETSRASR